MMGSPLEIKDWMLNPLGFHLLSLLPNASIRQVIMYGGSSSGKSYSAAQVLLILLLTTGENILVMRKVGASISKTIYQTFKDAASAMGISPLVKFQDSANRVKFNYGDNRIDFTGLDDPEKIKGISSYRWVFMDEWSEFDEEDDKQVRLRLRGKAGQQIIRAFNPIRESHWIKKNVIDAEQWNDLPQEVEIGGRRIDPALTRVKSIKINSAKPMFNPRTGEIEDHAPDTVLIQTTYLNNFWVVGSPDGTYGYYDEQCVANFESVRLRDPDYYQVYALGEWGVIRTGSEFFSSFNRGVHCAPCPTDPALPIHVSVDSNVLPYITITGWQIGCEGGKSLRQVFELCADSPNNTVRKSAKLLADKLGEIGTELPIHLHGDASTRAANNIDEQKRSFHDLFIKTLESEGIEVIDKVGSKNPSVQMSGEFINAVLDGLLPGLSIAIGEDCKNSIDDYMAVQKDENGAILKAKVKNKATGQTYEEHGHISDTFRYVVCDTMKEEFIEYCDKRKRNTFNGSIRYFNPDAAVEYKHTLLYAIPNVGGKFAMVCGGKAGDSWHILGAALVDADSVENIKAMLVGAGSPSNVIESPPAYYPMVRELRATTKLQIKVTKEYSDMDRRIAATSDYVKSRVLFRSTDDAAYNAFIDNMLDYAKGGESREASAVLSGFVMYAEKSFSD